MMELPLDRCQIVEDVGVVELEIVQDGRARPVVHELAALVEERSVVLVGLDDEGAAIAKPRGHAEVHRHAAHQKAGLQVGVLQHPGEHRCRRRLAMRAGHREHMAVPKHVFGEPLRTARIRRAGVENRFDKRIAARDDIADDVHVRLERQLIGAIALDEVDAERTQLVAHRRVDIGIAAGDLVSRFAREHREPTHEGAANAENVDVHPAILGLAPITRVLRRPQFGIRP